MSGKAMGRGSELSAYCICLVQLTKALLGQNVLLILETVCTTYILCSRICPHRRQSYTFSMIVERYVYVLQKGSSMSFSRHIFFH